VKHVVVGGPHVNTFPDEAASFLDADFFVVGEGEQTLAELADNIGKRTRLRKTPGLILKSKRKTTRTPDRPLTRDLDSLPFPDRSCGGYTEFYSILDTEAMATTMLTSRGCPYRCTFCATPKGPYRERSAKNVADEMSACRRQGIKEFYFIDDTFNVRPERVFELCEEILRRRLEVKWSCRLRIDKTSTELLAAMRRAGCTRVQFGIETGTDEGLRVLNKGITVEQVRAAVASAKRVKMPVAAYFMLGCPHERSASDVERTIRLAKELDADMALFNVLTPLPGTPLFEEGVKRGVIDAKSWRQYFAEPRPDFVPPVWTEHFERDQLYALLDMAFKRFYLRPKVIWRNLLNLRNVKQLARKARAALMMLRS